MLDSETRQASAVMESEHKATPPSGLRMHHSSHANGVDLSTSGENLRSSSSKSSSSSPDSPFDDAFQDDYFEIGDSGYGEKSISGSSIPKDEQSDHGQKKSTESPPIQAMDHIGDPSPSHRIPSSVFARTKSTTPVEWSVASNESLFSIQMGNMSFSNDPMFWRSGELGLPGESTTSAQMFNFTPNQPPINGLTGMGKSSEGNVAEAAVETMQEVIRENAEAKRNKKLFLDPCVSGRSDISGASTQSFAFPILTGDAGKWGSSKRSGSPRVGPEHSQPQTPKQPQPQAEQPQPQLQPQPTAHQPPIPQTNWFSCFTCCCRQTG
ncbi:uncharacterized protein LOC131311715 isoform X3 [Rhododendron vialii]|nr:uncharacterized protein LOC131311715 isoform X3 [Rhododendron vialii]